MRELSRDSRSELRHNHKEERALETFCSTQLTIRMNGGRTHLSDFGTPRFLPAACDQEECPMELPVLFQGNGALNYAI